MAFKFTPGHFANILPIRPTNRMTEQSNNAEKITKAKNRWNDRGKNISMIYSKKRGNEREIVRASAAKKKSSAIYYITRTTTTTAAVVISTTRMAKC